MKYELKWIKENNQPMRQTVFPDVIQVNRKMHVFGAFANFLKQGHSKLS